MIEALTKTILYFVALTVVLFGFSSFSRLDKEAEDFLYLADIVAKVTNGKETQSEQIKALTAWLASNVTKTTEYPGWKRPDYPDWFDGSSVASVIKGGIGNCGQQATNIITLSRYLGITEHRRYWIGKNSGSNYEHTFAEMVVDGKPGVFDPNALMFQENEKNEVLSLKEMVQNPSKINNEFFRTIATEIRNKPNVLMTTDIPRTPLPLGEYSYHIYTFYGKFLTVMYIHLKSSPLVILILTWLVFGIVNISLSTFLRRTSKNINA